MIQKIKLAYLRKRRNFFFGELFIYLIFLVRKYKVGALQFEKKIKFQFFFYSILIKMIIIKLYLIKFRIFFIFFNSKKIPKEKKNC